MSHKHSSKHLRSLCSTVALCTRPLASVLTLKHPSKTIPKVTSRHKVHFSRLDIVIGDLVVCGWAEVKMCCKFWNSKGITTEPVAGFEVQRTSSLNTHSSEMFSERADRNQSATWEIKRKDATRLLSGACLTFNRLWKSTVADRTGIVSLSHTHTCQTSPLHCWGSECDVYHIVLRSTLL